MRFAYGQGHFEAIIRGGGSFFVRKVKGWGTQPTITPLIRNPPNEVKL